MIQFDAYDIYRDLNLMDHYLWLQDIPLCQDCNHYDGGTTLFPSNLSIADWTAFSHLAKPKQPMMQFQEILLKKVKEDFPSLAGEIESLFFSDNRYLAEDEKGLKINYARAYDFLKFEVDLKEIGYEKLNAFLAEHKDEIEKDFYSNFIKVIKANELFVRVAVMTNTLYYIFDQDEADIDRYIELFNRNNKWVFNTKVDKFNELFSALKETVNQYRQTQTDDPSELLVTYKKLPEYRRTLFKKYKELDRNFYLEFVD